MTAGDATPYRIGIWCAVSSKPQAADDKTSLDDQERQGHEFAASVGGDVVAVYRVPGHTRDLWRWSDAEAAMPAYRHLRDDVESGRLDVLHVLDPDRLGRDPALAQQVVSLVERNGGEVYFASSPHQIGQKSIAHRYITAIQSVRAGEDQALRVRRYRMGMKGRVEKRGMLPGTPPFYLRPVHDPHTGKVASYRFSDQVGALDLMTQLYLAGHSYAEIRRRLDASPWLPPGNSDRWWHRTIWETLRSDVPAGYPSWGPYRAAEPSDKFPARWDEDTHAAVIRERQRRSRAGYHRAGSSPLAKVALCGRCGGAMTRHLAKNMHEHYLRCNRHAYRTVYPHYDCHANHILESTAIDALAGFFRWLSDDGAVDQALADLGQGDEIADLQHEISHLRGRVQDLEHRKVRAGHAYAAGDMEISVYRQVNDDLTAQLDAAREQIDQLALLLHAMPDLDERRALLEDLAARFDELVATKEPAEVSTLLQQAGLRLYIENGQVQRIRLD